MTTRDISVTFRPGTEADSYTVFNIFENSIADLTKRLGSSSPTSIDDPAALARMWEERRSLYVHLARTADQFWIAEKDGQVIGFSRSILRGNAYELTELFVLPNQQSSGVGRELISRTFPSNNGAAYRTIIATSDLRAQALYLKSGVYPRFPGYYFSRQPEVVEFSSDLVFTPISVSANILDILGAIDEQVLGHRRDVDHSWLLGDRQGYLYTRKGKPVGYGYVGIRNSPFALLDAADFPAVLALAESQAAENGKENFGLEVPMVNRVVVDYLLERHFKVGAFITMMMTNKPFGNFENYILTSPPFFM